MMLETLREYGLEALAANEEMEVTRQAHAHYYLGLAEEAEPELAGPQQAEWLERLEREHDNLRAAMQWALERGDAEQSMELALRLGGALHQFWQVRRYLSEGRTFLERALAGSKEAVTASRAKALMIAARLAVLQADTERGEALCEGSLALCRELGDTAGMAYTLHLLGIVAWQRSELSRACSQFEASLALWRMVGDKNGIALALFYSASLALQQGDGARARGLCDESLALSKQEGNKEGIASALFKLAEIYFSFQGDPASVRSLLEESLTLYRELGDTHGLATCFCLSGQLALQQGDAAMARSLVEEGLLLYREIGGWEEGIGESLSVLGKVAAVQADYTAARAFYGESLTFPGKMDAVWIASSLEGLADVVAVQGDPMWVVRLYGAAEALRESVGTPLPPVERTTYERSVAAARAQLGEKTFATAWAQGRIMTVEQVLATQDPARILDPSTGSSSASPSRKLATYPHGLTAREVEVLRLLAQGLTSAQIAEQLVIGVVTVNFHVRSIYSKLGVTSRAAATRYALDHHLL
jgi:DNA-binding CsgD family transcriptional regulator/tetratricopeptide (TPR) repeat protein